MKVMLVNGSPHEKGCTYTALTELADTFEQEGIDTQLFWIGNKPLYSCIDCGKCSELGRCVFEDRVNEFLQVAGDYDGFIFASPVHYAGATGALTSFMGAGVFCRPALREKPLLFETRRSSGIRKASRDNGCTGSNQQILSLGTHADCFLALLEYGAWQYPARGQRGSGGNAECPYAGEKHGLVPALQGSRRKAGLSNAKVRLNQKGKHLSAKFETVRGDVRITKELPL